VVAVDFRQPPTHPYPAFAIDVNFAVRWLKSHAGDLGGDPRRVAALGSSSGGHIALLTSVRPFDPELASRTDASVGGSVDATLPCVVACWAISDPSARYAFAQQTGNTRLVEAHEATFVPFTRMAEANPRLIVERGAAQRLPPVLILQGTADNNVTPEIQAAFQQTYQAAGGQCELAIFEGLPHGFGNDNGDGTRAAVERIVPFLERYVGAGVSAAAGSRGGG
jgi:acetyl esterase/lipase